jgi:hypothetical protein
MIYAFITGQALVVLFIALHDWLPLGKLNNLQGIRAADSIGRLAAVTFLSTLPFAIALLGCSYFARSHFPSWLDWTLWISYGAGAYGILRAWWIPYLLGNDPRRAARYQLRFAQTHAFLPMRHGIRPDTLHVGFHLVLVTTIGLLVALTFSGAPPISQR